MGTRLPKKAARPSRTPLKTIVTQVAATARGHPVVEFRRRQPATPIKRGGWRAVADAETAIHFDANDVQVLVSRQEGHSGNERGPDLVEWARRRWCINFRAAPYPL